MTLVIFRIKREINFVQFSESLEMWTQTRQTRARGLVVELGYRSYLRRVKKKTKFYFLVWDFQATEE
jgi:hypothetical protein